MQMNQSFGAILKSVKIFLLSLNASLRNQLFEYYEFTRKCRLFSKSYSSSSQQQQQQLINVDK